MTTPRYRGPFWTPITPETGSLFHAETHIGLGNGSTPCSFRSDLDYRRSTIDVDSDADIVDV